MQYFLACLLFLLACGCGEKTVASAKETLRSAHADLLRSAESLRTAAGTVVEKVGEIDLSAAGEKIQGQAAWVVGWCAEQLEEVHDVASARVVAEVVTQVLDAARGLLRQAGKALPNREDVRVRIDALRARFGEDADIMAAAQPALTALGELLD